MKGRKPNPARLNRLLGKKAKGKSHVPPSAPYLPAPPDHLSEAAKEVWQTLGSQLLEARLVTALDEPAFALLCEAYAAWADLITKARTDGPIVKMNGQLVPNPYLARADKESEKVRKLLPEFGLSPSSRTRLDAGPAEDAEEREFMTYLANRNEAASLAG
jgi:P27 family predicted phage terminase small subunit